MCICIISSLIANLLITNLGTRVGTLFVANHEKHTCVELWNSAKEAEDEDADVRPSLRRLLWYPQQTPTDEPCLFIGLGKYSIMECIADV